MDKYEDFLAHYGVAGMKWGRRKSASSIKTSGDAKKVSNLRGRNVSSLSNNQLKTLNTRLNLERNYSDLTKEKSKVAKGYDIVKATLAVAGTGVAFYNLVKSPAGQAAIKVGKNIVINRG